MAVLWVSVVVWFARFVSSFGFDSFTLCFMLWFCCVCFDGLCWGSFNAKTTRWAIGGRRNAVCTNAESLKTILV